MMRMHHDGHCASGRRQSRRSAYVGVNDEGLPPCWRALYLDQSSCGQVAISLL
jgi:hypothetical protein